MNTNKKSKTVLGFSFISIYLFNVIVQIPEAVSKLMITNVRCSKQEAKDLRVVQISRQQNLSCFDVLLIKAN